MPENTNTAVVTGGSDGLGYAIAGALAAQGADLILVARDPGRLEAARKSLLQHGTSVHTLATDLSDPGAVTPVAQQILALTDRVDTLVNNAGTAHFGSLRDTSTEEFDAMWQLNVKVPFLLSRALLDALILARGSIINISSYWAHKMAAGRSSAAYSATRGAINSMTRALANELGPSGVRVNAIAPGAVHTPTYEHAYLGRMSPQQRETHDQQVSIAYPLGRIGRPQDIAEAAAYLASSRAQWTTGIILAVDGGLTVR
ncbi:SDR family NAD(P)-dependent oxidoreductase [Actinoallomurus soli]|uniref:SDR family NAD(P)-dependent oxidoreductase n=1 Tax=Actinoallomurus soli TaxID=2952535 RepID=UPI00209355EF|nr:SDR family oxidoreductase [Actinoallomurus soli]MCO5972727.1 SDR family oxidoreductase [Actinoallomurus soli]